MKLVLPACLAAAKRYHEIQQENLSGLPQLHARGIYYMTNTRLPKVERAKAVETLQITANRDYGRSQYSLGVCYKNGIGVPTNHVLAWKWLQIAANKGSTKAADLLKNLRTQMSPAEIAEGQRLAKEFLPQKENSP